MERVSSKQPGGERLCDMADDCRVSERRAGEFCAALWGDIDHHRAAKLRGQLDELICRERPRRLYLDLSGIDFMDSSGLGLIMGRLALLKRFGGTLSILDPSAAVMKMVKLAGMERMVTILRSKEK